MIYTQISQRKKTYGQLPTMASGSAFLPTSSPITPKTARVSAYSLEEAQTDKKWWEAAWGDDLREDVKKGNPIIASRDLPKGTKVKIGDITYTVKDRMNKRFAGTGALDILMPDKQTALNFGVQNLSVEIIPPEKKPKIFATNIKYTPIDVAKKRRQYFKETVEQTFFDKIKNKLFTEQKSISFEATREQIEKLTKEPTIPLKPVEMSFKTKLWAFGEVAVLRKQGKEIPEGIAEAEKQFIKETAHIAFGSVTGLVGPKMLTAAQKAGAIEIGIKEGIIPRKPFPISKVVEKVKPLVKDISLPVVKALKYTTISKRAIPDDLASLAKEARKVFKFQDTNQEKIIHSVWEEGNSYRFELEGSGDIFRELTKSVSDTGYIGEKIRRTENLLTNIEKGILHIDDSLITAKKAHPEKIKQLEKLWKKQPVSNNAQQVAKDLNIALVMGEYKTARQLLEQIKKPDIYTQAVKVVGEVLPKIKKPTIPRVLKAEQKVATQKQLKQRRDVIRQKLFSIKEVIAEHPAKSLSQYIIKGELPEVTGKKGLGIFKQKGDDIVTELGYADSESARRSYEGYKKLKNQQKELRSQLRELHKKPEFKTAEVSALGRKVKVAEKKVAKTLTAKQIIKRRRTKLKAVKQYFGLSDADLRSITKRDIRFMDNFEFKKFIDDIRIKAEKFAERRQSMNELQQQIIDKELNVENIRKAMKLPTMKNMTINDVHKLNKALIPFQKGDEFLSVRKLEVVDRTELKGIKTWREAREQLAKKLSVPIEELQNIKVSEFDRFRYDTGLAEKNPFYKMIVEEPAKRMLISEAEYLNIEKEIFALAKKLKPKGIIARLIPQQKNIRAFMEATPKKKLEISLTEPELELVKSMTKYFNEARDYLIQMEAMKMGKENYFTHIRRGILEAVKDDGITKAVKEVFTKYKEEEQAFNILDRATGEILAMDKFFKFAMHRVGKIKPTENVVKAFLTYMRIFKKKQALDEIVPLIDIYAHAITPKEATKTGVLLQGNMIKFVKEWLNTQKGRHITLIAKQGGKIDGTLRAIKMFTSLRDLGINIPVSIATEVGEQITTYQLLGKKLYALGKIRQNTKQGKAIIEKYRNFIGKSPWKEIIEPSKEAGDRLMEGIFILFRDASTRSNKTFLLGSLSKQEFKSGVIDTARLASLRTELGRYRMVEGMKSIIGATPEGKSYTQYKKWAIPILRTTIKNLGNIGKKLARMKVGSKEWKKSALELYRLVEITAFVMLIFGMVRDKDDNSFTGKIVNKAYREATTLIQALQPRMFLAAGRTASFIEDLGNNLTLILLGEKYKTTGKFKGVEKLKKQFTPVAVSQFKKPAKKKPPIIKGLKFDIDLGLDLDLNLDLDLDLGL